MVILKQARKLGVEFRFIGADAMDNPEIAALGAGAVEGFQCLIDPGETGDDRQGGAVEKLPVLDHALVGEAFLYPRQGDEEVLLQGEAYGGFYLLVGGPGDAHHVQSFAESGEDALGGISQRAVEIEDHAIEFLVHAAKLLK